VIFTGRYFYPIMIRERFEYMKNQVCGGYVQISKGIQTSITFSILPFFKGTRVGL
jgi:hypothetical protein